MSVLGVLLVDLWAVLVVDDVCDNDRRKATNSIACSFCSPPE